jgi:galactose-1-phosphate uridylyltransferase
MKDWLFQERKEMLFVSPPAAGIPPELEPFYKGTTFNEPVQRRREYFTDTWCAINMARASRPFTTPPTSPAKLGASDRCMFCPGKEDKTPRDPVTGEDTARIIGSDGKWKLRAFPNLYPWLISHVNIVETAEHKTGIEELTKEEIGSALTCIADLCKEYYRKNLFPVVFKNHGTGASIEHHHWQAGALPVLPRRIAAEQAGVHAFNKQFGSDAFSALLDLERKEAVRYIASLGTGEPVSLIAPFAPRTNFEVWIIPDKVAPATLAEAPPQLLKNFAAALAKSFRALHQGANISSLSVLCHQSVPDDKEYRVHFKIIPYKHYGGAERGFEEFVVETTPEAVAETIRKAIQYDTR